MRQPWVLITLAFMSGILCAPYYDAPANVALTVAILQASVAAVCILADWRQAAWVSLAIAFVPVGMLMAQRADRPQELEALLADAAFETRALVELEGIIAAHPERRPQALVFPLELQRITHEGKISTPHGGVRVRVALSERWRDLPTPFRWGDRVHFHTRLRPLLPSGNPGIFDFSEWLRRNGIVALAGVDSPLAVEIVERPGNLFTAISHLKVAMEEAIARHFGGAEGIDQRGAMLEAFILGNRGLLEEESIAPLRRAGLMHIIAISGFHVWALNLLCIGLFRLMRLPNVWAYGATAAVTLLYWGLAAGRSSVTRAALVALVYLLGRILSRRTFNLNSLAFAAFIILAMAPRELFDAGFQLTFGAALGIVVLLPRIMPWFSPLGWAGQALAVGVASQLVVLPLTAWHFHMVNVQSVITTFLVFPLVAFSVLAGFLFLLFLHLIPVIAELTAASLAFSFGLLQELSVWFDKVLPFALRMPSPPLWLLFFYGLCLFAWVVLNPERRQVDTEEPLPPDWKPLLPVALLLVLIVLNPVAQPLQGAWRLHQIDVGQGSSLLIESPDGAAALVDGGGTPVGDYDIGESVVSPVLWYRGHRSLDVVMATHGDDDHAEGLLAVLRNFAVGELWLPREVPRTPLVNELIDIAQRRGVRIRHFSRGDESAWRDTDWRFFNPPLPPYAGRTVSNRNSLVALARLGDFSLMVTGDADIPALTDITAEAESLRADVLCVPHHGSTDALLPAFLDAVQPEIALISAGRDNSFGFPRPSVLRALRQRAISICTTGELGAVTLIREPAGGFLLVTGREQQVGGTVPARTGSRE